MTGESNSEGSGQSGVDLSLREFAPKPRHPTGSCFFPLWSFVGLTLGTRELPSAPPAKTSHPLVCTEYSVEKC